MAVAVLPVAVVVVFVCAPCVVVLIGLVLRAVADFEGAVCRSASIASRPAIPASGLIFGGGIRELPVD